jgi:hypothetical protein
MHLELGNISLSQADGSTIGIELRQWQHNNQFLAVASGLYCCKSNKQNTTEPFSREQVTK